MKTAFSRNRTGYAALRKGRFSKVGQIYLVTFTTCGRRKIFAEPELARIACHAFIDPRLWLRSQLLAWVLMPDHWHGLLQLGEGDRLSARLQALKANSARAVRCMLPATAKIWAKGFHEHALRSEQDLVGVARHIVANPLRAGLVQRVGEYPYWDAVWL